MPFGQLNYDWCDPIDYARLRSERLARAHQALEEQELDAILCFQPDNIRYITGTMGIPIPKMLRYCILPLSGEPILYELGGDYERVKENAPWMTGRIHVSTPVHLVYEEEAREWARELKETFKGLGVANGRIGIDQISLKVIAALESAGLKMVDASPAMALARIIKTRDEIECLKASVRLAEFAFAAASETIKPGARECDVRAAMSQTLFLAGCEMVRGVITARSSPYWRTFNTDRPIRKGDLVIIDNVHIYNGYACDHVRTFLCGDGPTAEQRDLYKRCYHRLYDALEMMRPGNTTGHVAEKLAEAEDHSESTIHFGHGIGLDTHEYPYITFLSKRHPVEIKPNMTFAVETYVGNERQGVRLEENLVVTDKGYEIISLYPLEEQLLS